MRTQCSSCRGNPGEAIRSVSIPPATDMMVDASNAVRCVRRHNATGQTVVAVRSVSIPAATDGPDAVGRPFVT